MSTAWVIEGHAGQYSDQAHWTVQAHETERGANIALIALREAASAAWEWMNTGDNYETKWDGAWKQAEQCKAWFALDAHADSAYGEPTYRVVALPLVSP